MIRYEISACQKSPDKVKWVEGTEWVQETEWVQGVAENDEVDRINGVERLEWVQETKWVKGVDEVNRLDLFQGCWTENSSEADQKLCDVTGIRPHDVTQGWIPSWFQKAPADMHHRDCCTPL